MIRGGPELADGGSPWSSHDQTCLLKAAIGPNEQVEASFNAWLSLVDLDQAVDGGTFRMLPLLFMRLQSLGCDSPLMGRLKGVYRQAWCENHLLLSKLAPVLSALQDASVDTMLLKGAPLALSYYKSHAARPMLDLDVAIRADQADLAREVMQALGWRMLYPAQASTDFHAMEFRNADAVEFDLHVHVMRETPYKAADEWFWRGAQPLDFYGVKTLQPRPTAMLVNTLLHGVRTNYEPPIRWIADAVRLIQAAGPDIDWRELVQFAGDHGVAHRLHLGLNYLAETYQVPVPPDVVASLARVRTTLVERIENIIYLGPPQRLYRPTLFPMVDYWRFFRCRGGWAFATGYLGYLQRHWQLPSRLQVPVAVVTALGRSLRVRTLTRNATGNVHAGL